MNSLYGGRQGTPFVLKKRYRSITAMTEDFADVSTLDEVGYGEYVIIDTVTDDKDYYNADNGKLYKRGFDGAEFISTIVGPSGANWSAATKIEYALGSEPYNAPTSGWVMDLSSLSKTTGKDYLWSRMVFKDEGAVEYVFYTSTLQADQITGISSKYAITDTINGVDPATFTTWYSTIQEAINAVMPVVGQVTDDNHYLWVKNILSTSQHPEGNTSYSVTLMNGEFAMSFRYANSTSDNVTPTEWSTEKPGYENGKYMWTEITFKYFGKEIGKYYTTYYWGWRSGQGTTVLEVDGMTLSFLTDAVEVDALRIGVDDGHIVVFTYNQEEAE